MESQVCIEKSLLTVWPERLSVHGTEEDEWAESHSGDAHMELIVSPQACFNHSAHSNIIGLMVMGIY